MTVKCTQCGVIAQISTTDLAEQYQCQTCRDKTKISRKTLEACKFALVDAAMAFDKTAREFAPAASVYEDYAAALAEVEMVLKGCTA